MTDFLERLIEEERQLAEKLDKLKKFKVSDSFHSLNEENRQLLFIQSNIMEAYLTVLNRRIYINNPELSTCKR